MFTYFKMLNLIFVNNRMGFPGGASGKEPVCQCRRCKETWVPSLSWEDPLEKEMATHPVFLPGESLGQSSRVGHSPWSHKELDTTEAA